MTSGKLKINTKKAATDLFLLNKHDYSSGKTTLNYCHIFSHIITNWTYEVKENVESNTNYMEWIAGKVWFSEVLNERCDEKNSVFVPFSGEFWIKEVIIFDDNNNG